MVCVLVHRVYLPKSGKKTWPQKSKRLYLFSDSFWNSHSCIQVNSSYVLLSYFLLLVWKTAIFDWKKGMPISHQNRRAYLNIFKLLYFILTYGKRLMCLCCSLRLLLLFLRLWLQIVLLSLMQFWDTMPS